MKRNLNFIHSLKEKRSRGNNESEVVEIALKGCLGMIEAVNEINKTSIMYSCPSIIGHHIGYDITNITLELNKELRIRGFKTKYIKPNHIHISWD